MNYLLADIILIIHFFIAFFVFLGLFFPIPYKLNWNFAKNFYLRFVHLLLITIILFETLIGFICPLTIFENILRGNTDTRTFISKWLQNLLFWDFSIVYFILIYFICFFWTVFIWFYYPPKKINM
ncbi:MAG: hypothetical protein CFH01_00098 [Alphaproteobacteria bacterium MarineAlpha2_Bin1]|nr:MAG: hypothetical protein CFH01_00098 [Alphaproteobacteria bacterium MarineAlpha2_Bin1]